MSNAIPLCEAADLLGVSRHRVVTWIYDDLIRVDSIGPDGSVWVVQDDVLALLDPRLLERQPGDPKDEGSES